MAPYDWNEKKSCTGGNLKDLNIFVCSRYQSLQPNTLLIIENLLLYRSNTKIIKIMKITTNKMWFQMEGFLLWITNSYIQVKYSFTQNMCNKPNFSSSFYFFYLVEFQQCSHTDIITFTHAHCIYKKRVFFFFFSTISYTKINSWMHRSLNKFNKHKCWPLKKINNHNESAFVLND